MPANSRWDLIRR